MVPTAQSPSTHLLARQTSTVATLHSELYILLKQRPSEQGTPLYKGHLPRLYRRDHFIQDTLFCPILVLNIQDTLHTPGVSYSDVTNNLERALFSASSSSSPFSDIGGVHIVSSASTWPHTSTQSYTSPASPSSHICSLLPPSGDTTMHNFSFTIQLQYTFGEQTHVQNFKQFNKFYRPHYNTHSDAENRNLCLLIIIHVLIGQESLY